MYDLQICFYRLHKHWAGRCFLTKNRIQYIYRNLFLIIRFWQTVIKIKKGLKYKLVFYTNLLKYYTKPEDFSHKSKKRFFIQVYEEVLFLANLHSNHSKHT